MDSTRQQELAIKLQALLRKRVPTKVVVSEPQPKVVQQAVVTGVYKIPESDKPFSIYFTKPLEKIVERPKPVTSKEYTYCIKALLSKNPHFTYIQSVKVGSNPTTYWFKDDRTWIRKISDTEVEYVKGKTLVLTEQEINRKLK